MNLSGEAVRRLARYYKIEVADMLVVADDVDLPLGRLRARRGGSAGGHNGFKSIIEQLGTTSSPGCGVGVGRGETGRDLADHVLGAVRVPTRDRRLLEAVRPRGRCRRDVRRARESRR